MTALNGPAARLHVLEAPASVDGPLLPELLQAGPDAGVEGRAAAAAVTAVAAEREWQQQVAVRGAAVTCVHAHDCV